MSALCMTSWVHPGTVGSILGGQVADKCQCHCAQARLSLGMHGSQLLRQGFLQHLLQKVRYFIAAVVLQVVWLMSMLQDMTLNAFLALAGPAFIVGSSRVCTMEHACR